MFAGTRVILLSLCSILVSCADPPPADTVEQDTVEQDTVEQVDTTEQPRFAQPGSDASKGGQARGAVEVGTESDKVQEVNSRPRVLPKQRGDQWPRFLGTNMDSTVAAHSDQIDFSIEPEFLWTIEVGPGYGIGSVSQGRYLHMDAADRRGSSERLRCFDFDNARELWSSSQPIDYRDMLGYEDGPRASPTIVGDLVYTHGVTGLLTCRRISDGEVLWTVDTQATYGFKQNFFGVASAPLFLDGRLIVMVGGSPPEDQDLPPMMLDRMSPNGSAVVAFDPETGAELWRCGDDLASYSSPRPIKLGEETLVLLFGRSGLMAIDPEAGEVRWRYAHRAALLESVNGMVPLIQDDLVFISECYQVGSVVLKVSSHSAEVVWKDPPRDRRRQAMRCHWSTPLLADGFIYGCSGRNPPDSDFRCVKLETGEVQWSDPRRVRSSVTRCGDHLLVLEERGTLQVIRIDPQKLDVVAEWDMTIPSGERPRIMYPCWSAPLVVGNRLVIRGDRRVICLTLAQRQE